MRWFFVILSLSIVSFMGCSHGPIEKVNDEAVVLLHGYGRSTSAMYRLEIQLNRAGYDVVNIGYRSLTQTINGIKKQVKNKISKQKLDRYKKVHFVGHSMGGLLIRSYLGENVLSNLGHVVLLGSPNKGTPVVDYVGKKWWSFLGGPAMKSMSTKDSQFLANLKYPNYPLGVIAGSIEREQHEHILVGKDDGLVPLESTKVEGMKDFLVISSSHYYLRYSQLAALQTIHFLKNGKFKKLEIANYEKI